MNLLMPGYTCIACMLMRGTAKKRVYLKNKWGKSYSVFQNTGLDATNPLSTSTHLGNMHDIVDAAGVFPVKGNSEPPLDFISTCPKNPTV